MLLIDTFSAEALRDRLRGHLALPEDEDYDVARRAWNLTHDLRPAMVALPVTAEDVREIVLYAREQNLRVLIQGTGHNGTPVGDLSQSILVRTTAMRGVEIDAEARVARVQAGAVWSDVTAPASEHGLAPLAGSAPGVGVVGYCVGGGVGWLGRRYGLCCERVLSFDVVTADGRLVRADRHSEPDLYWALRGGGGSYAAVVGLELELIPLPAVTAGMMIFGGERAREILQSWRAFTASAPDTVTTAARLLQVPDIPGVPQPLRGRNVVAIDGAIIGDAGDAAAVLAPLRALGPEMDTFADVPPGALSYIHMDPEEPMPGISTHALMDALPSDAVDALVEGFGDGSGTSLMVVELRHVGGALARPSTAALSHLPADYLMFAGSISMGPEADAMTEVEFARLHETVAPWCSTRVYANFAESPCTPVDLYGEDAAARLQAIRDAYDPDRRFLGAQAR
jgi:FAD/FMN-containing dehydrogenase